MKYLLRSIDIQYNTGDNYTRDDNSTYYVIIYYKYERSNNYCVI